MIISQLNSKTVYLKKAETEFLIQYYYHWNGVKKEPESVILKKDAISAFFLTSLIKDRITETAEGFSIHREWNIVPEGELGLVFCLDLVSSVETPLLVPCLLAGEQLPAGGCAFWGERLSQPSALYLFPGESGLFLGLDVPCAIEDFASLSLSRARLDRYHCLRVEFKLPPVEKFPVDFMGGAGFEMGEEERVFTSPGHQVQSLGLHVLMDTPRQIFSLATNFAHDKWEQRQTPLQRLQSAELKNRLKSRLEKCLKEFSIVRKGVCGVLDHAGAESLTITTGMGLALLIQQLFGSSTEAHEFSLRLADFALKAQHPSGVFFSRYYHRERNWLPRRVLSVLKKGAGQPAPLDLLEAGRIVEQQLLFAGQLQAKGLPHYSYFSAATVMLDFLVRDSAFLENLGERLELGTLQTRAPGLPCLALLPAFLAGYKLTKQSKYHEAILVLKENLFQEFYPPHRLPAADPDGLPDFHSALLLLQSANIFTELGLEVEDRQGLINNILPWIYYNRSSHLPHLALEGGILDSFDRCRILCRGYELAYQLLCFRKACRSRKLRETLASVIADLLRFAASYPLGQPFIEHTRWSAGEENPADNVSFHAGVFAREGWFLLQILEEFPDFS